MNEKELKERCRASTLPLSRNKAVLIARVMTHLESISDLECASLEHLNLMLEDGTCFVKYFLYDIVNA